MTHFLKSISLLVRLIFLHFTGYFSPKRLEYPIFYTFMTRLDFNTNSCIQLLETNHGLEPLRDIGRNFMNLIV